MILILSIYLLVNPASIASLSDLVTLLVCQAGVYTGSLARLSHFLSFVCQLLYAPMVFRNVRLRRGGW